MESFRLHGDRGVRQHGTKVDVASYHWDHVPVSGQGQPRRRVGGIVGEEGGADGRGPRALEGEDGR
eukprot:5788337-Prorocentrum_lima.AAC.1